MWFYVLLLTFPIFYIIGIVSFIDFLVNRNKNRKPGNRKQFLEQILADIAPRAEKNPGQTISELTTVYRQELAESMSQPFLAVSPVQPDVVTQAQPVSQPVAWETARTESVLANWYRENSVNLLLYVGAFLIVVTASILVGFNWQNISVILKSLLLISATLFFIVSGLVLFRIPRVKSAGAVFSAIGTMLIPFSGIGLYNFVLRDLGFSVGGVWGVTSIVEILVSLSLGAVISSSLYTYVAGLGSLSFVLAMVNSGGLTDEYYILGAQFSAFILLLVSRLTGKYSQDQYVRPLQHTADIIAPTSLVFGLFKSLADGTLFTVPAAIAVFAGALFYLFNYLYDRKNYQQALSQILAFIGGVILVNAYHLYPASAALWLTLYPLFFTLLACVAKYRNLESEYQVSGTLAVFISIILYTAYFNTVGNIYILEVLSLVPVLLSAILYFLSGNGWLVIPAALFVWAATAHFLYQPGVEAWLRQGVFVYLMYAVLWYYASTRSTKSKLTETLATAAAVLFFIISWSAAYGEHWYLAVITLVGSGVLIDAALRKNKPGILYPAYFGLYWTLWNFLIAVSAQTEIFPFAFTALSITVYLVSWWVGSPWQFVSRLVSYAGMLAGSFGSLVYIWYIPVEFHGYRYYIQPNIESQGLINAYAATIFFWVDMYVRKSRRIKYFATFVTMLALSWQCRQLGIHDTLFYTVWWGIYAAILAVMRRIDSSGSYAYMFDNIANLLLVIPPLIQTGGKDGARAAIVLGISGIFMLIYGISKQYKNYTYAGIFAIVAAVLSQTYSYILGLEKWVMTGILGAGFLGLALYILLRRGYTNRN